MIRYCYNVAFMTSRHEQGGTMFRYKFLSMVILVGVLFSQSVPSARAATGCDSAEFVSDLTIPDGSSFTPGTTFTKTWRLLNNGTCTWSTYYSLVWVGGEKMGAPASVRIPVSVPPGQMLDLSIRLTAPSTAGHYTALFKLSNASAKQFGIGISSSNPFWVDINVVDVSAVVYDFVANAPYAQWRSGAGGLPFPGASGDYRGYSSQVDNPHLEDDSYDTGPGLLTVPQNRLNGYIQATYPEIEIQTGDKLQTLVNCEFGATGCYATFRIDYILPNNTQRTLWSWRESYDRRFYRANLNLNALAGQRVRFVFMLQASGSAGGDRAIWGSPRIVRPGTGQPPAPPATLTPLPPLPPTATPLVNPPPTLQPTGCDKAAFVADITVPDGTMFTPGVTFTKTWRLKNAGTCVWTTAYKLIYYSGEPMGTTTMVNLPWGAAAGQTVDISMNMVAPSAPGNYRGFWILANANGQYFGIGSDASKPIWVEINVSGEAAQQSGYSFWMNACSAQWRTSSGSLPCPGTEGDSKGFVIASQSTQLEDGTQNSSLSLLMSPENKYNGYIQGVFPAITVLPGDRFITMTGCENGYSCYATFRLDYISATGVVYNFWSWREQKDGKNNYAVVDLTPLAGRSVRFILSVLATGYATGDRVRWIDPQIVRAVQEIPPTFTPSPTFTPAPSLVVAPQIRDIAMFDSLKGWAVGNSHVLRTIDGGVTWYNYTMPGVSSVGNAFFQNASKGWVIGTSLSTSTPTLYRTVDGGRTWIVYGNLPFTGGIIQFLDDQNGFVMAGIPIGMQKHPIQLYQTSDGGATWTLKYAHDPSQTINTLPLSGSKKGMTFRNTTTGWIGGDTPMDGFVYLYKTTDGGVTWAQQNLALPTGYESAFITTSAPTFFTANDAILPVWMTIGIGMRDLFIYTTHDGGNTWTRSYRYARNAGVMDFVTIRDIFTWSGTFLNTHDGGYSWSQITPNVSFAGPLHDMDFVSNSVGWMLDYDYYGNSALYRTTNGGYTWTTFYNTIPPQPMPDLTITDVRIELQNTSCLMQGDAMGVRITVKNNGQAAAGSFVVRVNNVDQTVTGLDTGASATLFYPGYVNPVAALVDATNTVLENNEANNSRSEMVPVPTPPIPCVSPAAFAQDVVNTLNARNFDALPAVMDQNFVFAYWESQGTSYPSDQAIQSLRTSLTVTLTPDPNKDLNALLAGLNPYSIMGLDPSKSYGLFVSGWGSDGNSEAILYFTQRANGSLYWHSVLIAPTKFIYSTPTPSSTPAALIGPYAVVRVVSGDVLNIRSSAGATQPVVGSFPYDAVNVMRTGPTASADSATWWEVQNPGGGTGWVNSSYLTEYVTHDAFCADTRIPILLEQLKGSMNQLNGDMFASLVNPTNGVNVHLWAYAAPINFTATTARNAFTSTEIYNWGSGPRGTPDLGTFKDIIQPKVVEVLNAPNMETYCDNLTKVFNLYEPWKYGDIRYYNLYKPATSGVDFDFRTWLIGFEYINRQPYLHSMVTIVWEP